MQESSLWRLIVLGMLGVVLGCAQALREAENVASERAKVDSTAAKFLSYAHSFDYQAMRANATAAS